MTASRAKRLKASTFFHPRLRIQAGIYPRRYIVANANTSIEAKSNSDRITRIVCDQLGIPEADVTPEKNFVQDMGADSLDRVELIMAVEDEFAIEIPDGDAEKLTTVGAVLEYVAQRKA